MSRALIIVRSNADRERAGRWAAQAPFGTRIEFKATKRTVPQNAKFWALLSDVASQLVWYGQKLTTEDWKLVFLDALTREARVVPNIDRTGVVALRRSSDLSKEEMSEAIEIILAFGAKHGIVFHDDESPALAPNEEREREMATT
jgi:hypothetical protein